LDRRENLIIAEYHKDISQVEAFPTCWEKPGKKNDDCHFFREGYRA